MGSKERREREKHELRCRILDAAREMFATEGFAAVTMRSLAKRIEYSATAIYLHFKDKESLISELCRLDLAELSETIQTATKGLPLAERMHAAAKAYVRFALAHPTQYRLLFMTPKPGIHQPDASEFLMDPDRKAYLDLRQHFAEFVESGLLKPEFRDADMLAQIYFCGLHGIVATAIAMGDFRLPVWHEPERQAEAFVDALLRGLQTKTT